MVLEAFQMVDLEQEAAHSKLVMVVDLVDYLMVLLLSPLHGLLPLEEAVVPIMMLEATMVLVEQVEQPMEAQVVL
tara:strand:- start:240 stop:464 length:225 start_codon:yes stop_codon:yes gene_type:complete